MDISSSKEDLSKVLYLAQSIVEKKTTMPILTNVLLSASDGKFKVSATDLEITSVTSVSADIHTPGSTTVSARVLGEIVRELPDGPVRLKVTEGERLEISAGKSTLKVVGVSADEYPALPGIGIELKSKISAAQLVDMVNKTLYSVSHDETRFNLNGVCFSTEGTGKKTSLKMVATDGHRLALINRPIEALNIPEGVIVPRKGLMELKKILSETGDAEVGIEIEEGFLVLEAGDSKISMRLIDGEFPDYNQVIPDGEGTIAKVDSEEFVSALKRVALMVTDKGKCVKLDFASGSLGFSSSSPELGEARDEIPVEYGGDPVSIAFNARYLLDFAASLEEKKSICIELHGDLGPARLFAEGDDSSIGIVMPMRLN